MSDSVERPGRDVAPLVAIGDHLIRAAVIAGGLAIGCAATQIAIEVVAVGLLGIAVPTSVEAWLQSLLDHRLIAIVELTVLQIPLFALLAVVFTGLAATLIRRAPVLTVVSTLFGLLGIAVYLASNPALALAGLSEEYGAAPDAGTRATIVAAAKALLAVYDGIGLDVGSVLILVAVGGLSIAMRREGAWNRAGPALGIGAVAGSSLYYVAIPLGPSRIFILEAASGVFLVWLLLVTLGLRRRTRSAARGRASPANGRPW